MKKSLLALATGSFALGFAEFVMMGILPVTASGLYVSVPAAGTFISAYALGVCVGTLFLVFGRRVPPKRLLLGFVALVALGNAAAALAPNAEVLVAARFVSGLPHGAFFGTATIVARELAEPGREGQAVSIMVLGQTVANMVGVPGGTLLAGLVSWRAAFVFVAVWALGSCPPCAPSPTRAWRASSASSRSRAPGWSSARCCWATPACSAGGATCRRG